MLYHSMTGGAPMRGPAMMNGGGGQLPPSQSRTSMIRDVWEDNLEEEFRTIRELVQQYPYVGMDTEFPGIVAKPVGNFKTTHEFYYQTLRCNVNLLKLIQLGISLMNERGEVPDKCCTWQFNFRFCLDDDIYAQDSIDLLKNGGINFEHLKNYGIDMNHFAELLITSGLVLCPEVQWLTFHSGYDFGYLLRIVTGKELPEREEEFSASFHLWFPGAFDIKYMLRHTDLTHSLGLDSLADILGLRRVGIAHQAGSDSLLTGHAFFKLVRERFDGKYQHCRGVLYALSEDAASAATPNVSNSPPTMHNNSQSPSFPSSPASSAMQLVMHGGTINPKSVG
jgi:CCR4-NOT transcription complex subunit 7/8